ncbi:MAG TPA: TSUP family transporter, partial [Vicinamibacterales bacterium]|nr:TSUP family transporter [Vicinamibacterales bacterium]
IAGYLLVIGAMLVLRAVRHRPPREVKRHVGPLGFFGALLDAVGGGGWGPIVASHLLVRGHDFRRTVGTVNAVEFFVTLTISSVFLAALPAIDWSVVAPLAAGAALAAPFAARATRRMPTRVLGTAVGALIILLSARTIALALLR